MMYDRSKTYTGRASANTFKPKSFSPLVQWYDFKDSKNRYAYVCVCVYCVLVCV